MATKIRRKDIIRKEIGRAKTAARRWNEDEDEKEEVVEKEEETLA